MPSFSAYCFNWVSLALDVVYLLAATAPDLGYGVSPLSHSRIMQKEMGIPDHLTLLLRNPYAGQEATVRTGHGTTDWFQIGKGVYIKAGYCHPAYLTYMQRTS